MLEGLASRLRRRPFLADLIIGVIGNTAAPSELLRPASLWALVVPVRGR